MAAAAAHRVALVAGAAAAMDLEAVAMAEVGVAEESKAAEGSLCLVIFFYSPDSATTVRRRSIA